MDLELNGEIVPDDEKWIYDWWEISAVCPKDVKEAIRAADGEDITLYINSPGGDVTSASEIRSALKDYKGKTKAVITGIAASAATVIMTGAGRVEAHATALIMIHKAATLIHGNADDMSHAKEMLDEVDKAIAHAYAEKTGKTLEECLEMMKSETWMDVDRAVEMKLVDSVIKDETESDIVAAASLGSVMTAKMKSIAKSAKGDGKPHVEKTAEEIADIVLKKIEAKREKEQKQSILGDLSRFGR